jgi:hypothetical protein
MSAVGPSLNSLARSRHLASLASSSALSREEPILVRPAFGEKVRAAIHLSIFALKSPERHIAATGDVKYFRNRIPCTGGQLPFRLLILSCAQVHLRTPADQQACSRDAHEIQSSSARDLPWKGKLSARPKLMSAALASPRCACARLRVCNIRLPQFTNCAQSRVIDGAGLSDCAISPSAVFTASSRKRPTLPTITCPLADALT